MICNYDDNHLEQLYDAPIVQAPGFAEKINRAASKRKQHQYRQSAVVRYIRNQLLEGQVEVLRKKEGVRAGEDCNRKRGRDDEMETEIAQKKAKIEDEGERKNERKRSREEQGTTGSRESNKEEVGVGGNDNKEDQDDNEADGEVAKKRRKREPAASKQDDPETRKAGDSSSNLMPFQWKSDGSPPLQLKRFNQCNLIPKESPDLLPLPDTFDARLLYGMSMMGTDASVELDQWVRQTKTDRHI